MIKTLGMVRQVLSITPALCLIFSIFAGTKINAQVSSSGVAEKKDVRYSSDDYVIHVSKFRDQCMIDSLTYYHLANPGQIRDEEIPALSFTNRLPPGAKQKLPLAWVEQELFLRFTLANDSSTATTLAFYPGIYFNEIQLFEAESTSDSAIFTSIRQPINTHENIDAYRIISLDGYEQKTIFARLRFLRAPQNTLTPVIMRADFIAKHQAMAMMRRSSLDVITYVASGMMLMMIFYSLAVYTQNGSKEFLYYSCYAACIGSLLFFIAFLGKHQTWFNHFYIEYLDLMILCTSVLSYLAFMKAFLDTRKNHPFLHKLFHVGQAIILLMMLLYSAIYFLTSKFFLLALLEDITKMITLLLGIVFITYGLKRNDRLMRFLVAGNIALVSLSIVSLILLMKQFGTNTTEELSVFNRPLVYYELGLVLELMLFLTGLAYKNRTDIVERVKERARLKLENERKEFEKQMAVITAQQNERDRISADMHDELGSGVTAIRLMSEIVKSKMGNATMPEINKISNSANELLNKMNTIIWTMKSSNDTLASMIAYIRAHATEYFDGTHIQCTVHTPPVVPDIEMSGEKRRNIFLGVKESLTNIIKHAQASEVSINITTYNELLVIEVTDNGKGMDIANTRQFGNGLQNMSRRMESIGGKLIFGQDNGTVLRFELDL